jgi:hypothetical protein
VLQDALTLHGKQFKDAALIVASPPCQEFSYMAMPWSLAKQKERDLLEGRDDPKRLTALFDACFRIQREACEAAGHHVPMVVENVRGAQKWVGRSRWNYGSYHLWGDVPALMPMTKAIKNNGGSWFNIGSPGQKVLNQNPVHDGQKVPGFRFDGSGRSFQTASVEPRKGGGGTWFGDYQEMRISGVKGLTPDGQPTGKNVAARMCGSKSKARKAASAAIAKIPFPLAQHIARYWKPQDSRSASQR